MPTTKNESTCRISATSEHPYAKSTEQIDETGSLPEEDLPAFYEPNSRLEENPDETHFEWPECMLARQAHYGIADMALAFLFFAILVAFCCIH